MNRRFRLPSAIGIAVLLAAALGWASTGMAFWPFTKAPTKLVATVQVTRDFYRNRFEESCHATAAPKWCSGFAALLNKTDRDLAEANSALDLWHQAKAAMPLQLNAIKADAAALAKAYAP